MPGSSVDGPDSIPPACADGVGTGSIRGEKVLARIARGQPQGQGRGRSGRARRWPAGEARAWTAYIWKGVRCIVVSSCRPRFWSAGRMLQVRIHGGYLAVKRRDGNNSSERSCFKRGHMLLNRMYLRCVNDARAGSIGRLVMRNTLFGACADLHLHAHAHGFPRVQNLGTAIGMALLNAPAGSSSPGAGTALACANSPITYGVACAYCAPRRPISWRSVSTSCSLQDDSGGRTLPPPWPTISTPALIRLTA